MPLLAQTRRVQRARLIGLMVEEIAKQEGRSIRTVYRLTAGPRFKRSLREARASIAIRRLIHGARDGTVNTREMTVLLNTIKQNTHTNGPQLSIQDLCDMIRFSSFLSTGKLWRR